MTLLKKTVLASIFLIAFCFTSNAQIYKSAIGARLGYPLSASYKTFLSESNAVEVYLGTRGFSTYRWVNLSAAYLIHRPIPDLDGLQWYFGAGASVFFWNWDTGFGEGQSTATIGLQGYLGLDYAFPSTPINLTVDWVPTIFLNGFGNGFNGGYGSVGVRYILSRG